MTLRLGLVFMAILFAFGCSRKDRQEESEQAAIAFEDYADDWIAFADATAGMETDARVDAFYADVAAKFPGFYIDRYKTPEEKASHRERVAKSIEGYDEIRERFIAKHEAFSESLADNVSAFRDVFTDFEPATKIALVHSLSEMDGGTRELNGERWLIFGVDGMVRYHAASSDERPFFTHELFHTYHRERLGECEVMWCALWAEGLAVYVAQTLFPNANEDELLLSLPPGMPAGVDERRADVAAEMLRAFDSEDGEVYAALFQFRDDGSGLPRRRGYYLGYLVARKLGETYSLHDLAAMDAATAKPLVRATLESLAAIPQPEKVTLESDGWTLYGEWTPSPDQCASPAALLLHKAAGRKEEYRELAQALAVNGVASLALDLRGHGESINLGKFEEPYADNLHINEDAENDIVAAINWLRARDDVEGKRIAVVGASYSGEKAAEAFRAGATARAYVMLSPGSFSDESIAMIDPSGAAWLFVRTEEEGPASKRYIDELHEALDRQAEGYDEIVYPGAGHATRILTAHPESVREIADWIAKALGASGEC